MNTIIKSGVFALSVAAGLAPTLSNADEPRVRPITNALTAEECSACHLAYQAGFLPERSWRAIMENLSDHYGEDASLGEDAVQEITQYLADNAMDKTSSGRRFLRNIPENVVPMRITEFSWFTHEHGSRLVNRANNSQEIGSISNCVACHQGADRGYFDDD